MTILSRLTNGFPTVEKASFKLNTLPLWATKTPIESPFGVHSFIANTFLSLIGANPSTHRILS